MIGNDRHAAILEEAADYIDGRLAPGRRDLIQDHLEECSACRAHYDLIERSRATVRRGPLCHLTPERIRALSVEALPQPSGDEAEHLAACSDCCAELAWARSAPRVERVARPAPGLGSRRVDVGPLLLRPLREVWEAFRRRPMWGAAGLGVATAVTVFFIFFAPGDRDRQFSDIAIVEPIPVPAVKGDEGEFARRLMSALEPYAAGHYADAARSLEELVPLAADPSTVLLYLGSAQLLDGQPGEAAQTLRGAMDRAKAPRLREEAAWQLAQALLRHGEGLEARAALAQVAGFGGMHAIQAGELLVPLGQRLGGTAPVATGQASRAAIPDSAAAGE